MVLIVMNKVVQIAGWMQNMSVIGAEESLYRMKNTRCFAVNLVQLIIITKRREKEMRKITLRPVNPSGVKRNLRSFWVEIEATRNNFEWIGNLHQLKNGKVEGCPNGSPCAVFNDAYSTLDYIKVETGSW